MFIVNMERINESVSWYQHKIGTYDKQLWERSVEKRVLKSIHNIPKKTVKAKPELIDVDLVRGSTFPKAKPRHGWLYVTRTGLTRVILLPVYFRWWQHQTNTAFTLLLILCYTLQVATLALYCRDPEDRLGAEDISAAHVVTPIIMVFLLGVTHAHIVATQEANRPRRKKTVIEESVVPREKKRKAKSSPTSTGQSDQTIRSDEIDLKSNPEVIGLRQRKFTSKSFLNRRKPGNAVNNGALLSGRLECERSEEADDETDDDVTYPKVKDTGRKVNEIGSKRNRSKAKLEDTDPYEDTTLTRSSEISGNITDISLAMNSCCNKQSEFAKLGLHKKKNCFQDDLNGGLHQLGATQQSHVDGDIVKTMVEDDTEVSEVAPFSLDIGEICEGFTEVTGELLESEFVDNPHSSMEERETYDHNPELLCPLEELDYLSQRDAISEIDRDSGVMTRNDTDSNSESNPHILEGAAYQKLNDPCVVQSWGQIIQNDGEINLLTCNDVEVNKSNVHTVLKPEESVIGRSPAVKPTLLNLNCESGKDYHVSSAESEAATTPPTPKLLGSEIEWGDHTDMTSCDSTSSNTATDSQMSDDDEFCDHTSQHDKETIPHIASVMNNLASGSDKVSCMIWEKEEVNKIDLTVLDIGWSIIRKVDSIPETCDYLMLGLVFSVLVALIPGVFRLYGSLDKLDTVANLTSASHCAHQARRLVFGQHWSESLVVINGMVQRCVLGAVLFFLLSVAERTFKQRLLYAKHFCYLTSSRRAKKYDMPHFRLNKVRNIKTWFSLRSYLKKRGPQRSVDTIVSVAFVLEVVLISVMCFQLLQDSETFLAHLGNWELIIWCMALAIYLLRFMTLGTKINKKYRNFSVLITEQINLYLQMEQKPHKKDELMMANSVLKLAEALLKELEIPFKISGLSANPFMYNITKVILLSAFSAVLTELLGFKLKLYKIKLRA